MASTRTGLDNDRREILDIVNYRCTISLMPESLPAQIARVRRFNRFYTREVGLLRKTFLDTPWSLGEMRVLFEIAHGHEVTATAIAQALELDPAYLSRLLLKFEQHQLIRRTRSAADARVSLLQLSAKGRRAFDTADRRQLENTTAMLERLPLSERERLVESMGTIETLLGPGGATRNVAEVELRPPATGDFGWIVSRHAELYRQEYGWGLAFEATCARIVTDFLAEPDATGQRCWMAERAGQRIGCMLLVRDQAQARKSKVARLRLLLVDPAARGLGLGRRLVGEGLGFARERGYRRVVLWTHRELAAARALYASFGFRLTGEEPHSDFGQPAVSEFWSLDL